MKNVCVVVFSMTLCLFCGRETNRNIEKLVTMLQNPRELTNDQNVLCEIHKYGKDAIPYLINSMDATEKIFCGFQDPFSSTAYPIHENYAGIKSAYMIEYILASEKCDEEFEFEPRSPMQENPYEIYPLGVIVKSDGQNVQFDTLCYEDIISVKKIYVRWWSTNYQKSLNQLREAWLDGARPLTGTAYTWI